MESHHLSVVGNQKLRRRLVPLMSNPPASCPALRRVLGVRSLALEVCAFASRMQDESFVSSETSDAPLFEFRLMPTNSNETRTNWQTLIKSARREAVKRNYGAAITGRRPAPMARNVEGRHSNSQWRSPISNRTERSQWLAAFHPRSLMTFVLFSSLCALIA